MGESILNSARNLEVYNPGSLDRLFKDPSKPTTPNEFFAQCYPDQIQIYGSPFVELTETIDQFDRQVIPVSINVDFFAGVLGGRRYLGHHVIYYEPEMAWYFLDSDGVYKVTTTQKLENLYRALLMKCVQAMPPSVHKLNLFHEWRTDRVAKQITNRAKSILAADSSFFSASSPHQRIRGVEVLERIARKFVDSLLTSESGQVLQLADAYLVFCRLLKERELPPVKRSQFRAVVEPLIRESFNVACRNDLVVDERQGVRGWKNVKLLAQTLPG